MWTLARRRVMLAPVDREAAATPVEAVVRSFVRTGRSRRFPRNSSAGALMKPHAIVSAFARSPRLGYAGLALAQGAGPPAAPAPAAGQPPPDPWPRVVDLKNGQVLVYQPQVNKWDGNRLDFRERARDQAGGREGRVVRRDLRQRAHAGRQGRAHRRLRGHEDHEDRLSDAARTAGPHTRPSCRPNSRRRSARSRSTG